MLLPSFMALLKENTTASCDIPGAVQECSSHIRQANHHIGLLQNLTCAAELVNGGSGVTGIECETIERRTLQLLSDSESATAALLLDDSLRCRAFDLFIPEYAHLCPARQERP